MITVSQLIIALQDLEKEGYGDFPIIYRIDTDFDGCKELSKLPRKAAVKDLKAYYMREMNDDEYEKYLANGEIDNVKNLVPNCVIIN
jgi:hypothetical protein